MGKVILTDIEIARANKMQKIDKIAEKLDIPETGLHHFGRHKAKVTFDQMEAPENDRVRYTISPAARREVLKRLLAENLARAGVEVKNPTLRLKRGGRKQKTAAAGLDLFGGGA